MASRAVVLAVLLLVLLFVLPVIAFAGTAAGKQNPPCTTLGSERGASYECSVADGSVAHHVELGFGFLRLGRLGLLLAEFAVPADCSVACSSLGAKLQSKSSVRFKLDGTLVAPGRSTWPNESISKWIAFSNVDQLTVTGDGTMDGKGEPWWKNSCRVHKNLKCLEAPTALLLSKCNHLKVEDIRLLNSQQMHMSVEDCKDVILKRITIAAPGDSPNTDGIHIARSKDIQVMDCNIKTGDGCMSIETGTENLYASKITCGPGHGISVGSLGDKISEDRVSNITVCKSHLVGMTNGARIKSWQGEKGYAKDITFEDIVMDKVKNPIIIDQNYCFMDDPLKPKACKKQSSAVELSDFQFKNVRGTSGTKDAIKLECSDAVPCHDLVLQDVKLTFSGHGKGTRSTCKNAKLKISDNVFPKTC